MPIAGIVTERTRHDRHAELLAVADLHVVAHVCVADGARDRSRIVDNDDSRCELCRDELARQRAAELAGAEDGDEPHGAIV